NLNTVAREVHELSRHSAKQLRLELALNLHPRMPMIKFDKALIHDAALNLLTNAIDACAENGGSRIEIQTDYDPEIGSCRLCVHNDGNAVQPEVQKRMMDPFFTTKGSKGNGLGLAIANKTLRAHGGELRFSTRNGR